MNGRTLLNYFLTSAETSRKIEEICPNVELSAPWVIFKYRAVCLYFSCNALLQLSNKLDIQLYETPYTVVPKVHAHGSRLVVFRSGEAPLTNIV